MKQNFFYCISAKGIKQEYFHGLFMNIQIKDLYDAKKIVNQNPGIYRVISIGNYNKAIEPYCERTMRNAKEHLYLEFDDITEVSEMYLKYPDRFRFCTHNDCIRALEFLKKGGDMLVHCSVGISRSPAVVLGYLLHCYKDAKEAVKKLFIIRYNAKPNLYIVKLMCDILGRKGNYNTVVDEIVANRELLR